MTEHEQKIMEQQAREVSDEVRRLNRVELLRKAAGGLSMDGLAKKVEEVSGEKANSSQINKLEKGSQEMTTKWMVRIARALEISPIEVIFDPTSSLVSSSDVDPLGVEPNDDLAKFEVDGRKLWVIRTEVMDELDLRVGDVVLAEPISDAGSELRLGDIVLCENGHGPKGKPITLIRQFIEPSLLTTNSITTNLAPKIGRAHV